MMEEPVTKYKECKVAKVNPELKSNPKRKINQKQRADSKFKINLTVDGAKLTGNSKPKVNPQILPDGEQFVCGNLNCRSTFIYKRNLLTHQKYHCGKAPKFECRYCSYKSKFKTDVRRHIRAKHSNQEVIVVDIQKQCQK